MSLLLCMLYTGYNGSVCQVEINECFSQPCLNYGACIDLIGDYEWVDFLISKNKLIKYVYFNFTNLIFYALIFLLINNYRIFLDSNCWKVINLIKIIAT